MRDMCNEEHDRNSVDTVNIFSDAEEKRSASPKTKVSKEDSAKSSTGDRTLQKQSKKMKKLKKVSKEVKRANNFS